MKLLVVFVILSIVFPLVTQNINAASTQRTVTITIEGKETNFSLMVYDFQRKVFVDVSDSLLAKITKTFGTDTFAFYNQVSKKQKDDVSATISPKIQVWEGSSGEVYLAYERKIINTILSFHEY